MAAADLSLLDTRQLRLLDLLHGTGSVTRTAELLGQTQPTVSIWLGRLRTQLGDPLFVRTPQGMLPTPRTEALIGTVREVLAGLRSIAEPPAADAAAEFWRAALRGFSHPTPIGADWRITDTAQRRRVVILVSREGHCLYDLLGRTSSGELDVDVSAVIGNHTNLAEITRAHGIPFHHVPFPVDDPEGKQAAFAQLGQLVEAQHPDAIVLARFMQVLPPELCAAWSGRAINIHHSFLPSFVGARPYRQAHDRGVKLIGATCHYVTADLDAGPIIEQDVIRVDHRDSVADMVRKGRDIEKIVLARGLRWHLEDRVLTRGNRTVIF